MGTSSDLEHTLGASREWVGVEGEQPTSKMAIGSGTKGSERELGSKGKDASYLLLQ